MTKTYETRKMPSASGAAKSPSSLEYVAQDVGRRYEAGQGPEGGSQDGRGPEKYVQKGVILTNVGAETQDVTIHTSAIASRGGVTSVRLLEADQLERLDINPSLTEEEKRAGMSLLWEFRELFATKLEEMGSTHLAEHEIHLKPNARPYYSPGT